MAAKVDAEAERRTERLRADYAAACGELKLCREALRRERLARWGVGPVRKGWPQ